MRPISALTQLTLAIQTATTHKDFENAAWNSELLGGAALELVILLQRFPVANRIGNTTQHSVSEKTSDCRVLDRWSKIVHIAASPADHTIGSIRISFCIRAFRHL